MWQQLVCVNDDNSLSPSPKGPMAIMGGWEWVGGFEVEDPKSSTLLQ